MKIIKEGKVFDLNAEAEEIKTTEVSTDISDKAKVKDKNSFEQFKELYKGQIDEKCIQDYGSVDNTKLWEDTAKEMFLASQDYIPEEDTKSEGDLIEKKTESVNHDQDDALNASKEDFYNLRGKDVFYVFEDFDTGIDKDQSKLIDFVNSSLNLNLDSKKDDLKIALYIQKMTGKEVLNLIRECYGDEIADKFEEFLDDSLETLDPSKIKYIELNESKELSIRDQLKALKNNKNFETLEKDPKDCGLYGFVSNNYYKMSTEQLKEIALDAIYVAENDSEIIDEYLDRMDESKEIKTEGKITDFISEEDLDTAIKNNSILNIANSYKVLDNMILEVTTDVGKSYYKVIKNDDGHFEAYLINKNGEKLGDEFILLESKAIKTEVNAIEFVELVDKLKALDLWDGTDETFANAVEKYKEILKTNKELKTEDQYENERRKGAPSVNKIAREEYEDNIEWYNEHIKDYKNAAHFISENKAEIASEYNLSLCRNL